MWDNIQKSLLIILFVPINIILFPKPSIAEDSKTIFVGEVTFAMLDKSAGVGEFKDNPS